MRAALRWPVAVWIATSAALILLAARVEYGAIVVGLYVGLNVLGMAIALTKQPPYATGSLRSMAWCGAAQLPVMVVPLFDRDLTSVSHRARELRSSQSGQPARRPKPDRPDAER
jgi:hypothetical protein